MLHQLQHVYRLNETEEKVQVSHIYSQIVLDNRPRIYSKELMMSSTNNVGETGYLDRLYVSHEYLHQGVASLILEQLEKYVRAKGIAFINTAASITSKPFFEAKGFIELSEQTVERRGVRLRRYLMEKKL